MSRSLPGTSPKGCSARCLPARRSSNSKGRFPRTPSSSRGISTKPRRRSSAMRCSTSGGPNTAGSCGSLFLASSSASNRRRRSSTSERSTSFSGRPSSHSSRGSTDLAMTAYRGPALEASDLWFSYSAGRPVLRGVSLIAEARQITMVLGVSGSGKTTLLKLCKGLLGPQRGVVRVLGGPVGAARRSRLDPCVAYIPQHLGLVRNLGVLDNVLTGALGRVAQLPSLLRRLPTAELRRAQELLERLGIRHTARCAHEPRHPGGRPRYRRRGRRGRGGDARDGARRAICRLSHRVARRREGAGPAGSGGEHRRYRVGAPAMTERGRGTLIATAWLRRAVVLALIAALIGTLGNVGLLDPERLVRGARNLAIFAAGLFPPDPSTLPTLGAAMIETIQIAFAGTAIGFALAVPLALLACPLLSGPSITVPG